MTEHTTETMPNGEIDTTEIQVAGKTLRAGFQVLRHFGTHITTPTRRLTIRGFRTTGKRTEIVFEESQPRIDAHESMKLKRFHRCINPRGCEHLGTPVVDGDEQAVFNGHRL